MLMKSLRVKNVNSGWYKIRLLEWSNFGDAETSAQVCRRLRKQLKTLHKLCRRLGTVLSKSLYKYTYTDTAITEMDSATGTICFGVPRINRHYLMIWNTCSIIPSSWSDELLPSFSDLGNLCSSLSLSIYSYPLTLYLRSSS
jgi:hypothetical protein